MQQHRPCWLMKCYLVMWPPLQGLFAPLLLIPGTVHSDDAAHPGGPLPVSVSREQITHGLLPCLLPSPTSWGRQSIFPAPSPSAQGPHLCPELDVCLLALDVQNSFPGQCLAKSVCILCISAHTATAFCAPGMVLRNGPESACWARVWERTWYDCCLARVGEGQ